MKAHGPSLVCGVLIGAICALAAQRSAEEAAPQDAATLAELRSLAADVRLIGSRVDGLRAAHMQEAAGASTTACHATTSGATPAPAPTPVRSGVELASATAVVERALSNGVWDDAALSEWRQLQPALTPSEAVELTGKLMERLNRGELRVATSTPPF